jgi:hypothetical protein
MTDSASKLNKGSCLNIQLAWKDENGVAIDITGRTFAITESSVPLVAAFAIVNAVGGLSSMSIADTSPFRVGRTNWFRIGMLLAGGCTDTTPQIEVDVQ